MALKSIEIHRDGHPVETFNTYESAAERLKMTADSLRTALSASKGTMVRRSSPIGAVVVKRTQEVLPITSRLWRVLLTVPPNKDYTGGSWLFPDDVTAAKEIGVSITLLRRHIRSGESFKSPANNLTTFAYYAPPGTMDTPEQLAGVYIYENGDFHTAQ